MKSPHEAHHTVPDYINTLPAAYLAWVGKVAAVLATIPSAETVLPSMAIEVDNVPILWDGCTVGYLVLSEGNGKDWDYCPAIIDKDVHPDGNV